MNEQRNVIEFLRRRWASAIRGGDDRTAARLRAQLDRIMNGRPARPDLRVVAAQERPPERRRSSPDLLAGLWEPREPGSAGAHAEVAAMLETDRAT